jgi:hypothetical protein
LLNVWILNELECCAWQNIPTGFKESRDPPSTLEPGWIV